MDNQRPQLDLKFYKDICPDRNGATLWRLVTISNRMISCPCHCGVGFQGSMCGWVCVSMKARDRVEVAIGPRYCQKPPIWRFVKSLFPPFATWAERRGEKAPSSICRPPVLRALGSGNHGDRPTSLPLRPPCRTVRTAHQACLRSLHCPYSQHGRRSAQVFCMVRAQRAAQAVRRRTGGFFSS
ncbi:hypothetical protein EDB85DRAFT_792969 [Lactarius pseudohatsudake]|nr:hypothetical protein EDB85DRAFT_792969 [Lactarius pseudohatsudake]